MTAWPFRIGVLARILTRLGARYYGEIESWDATVEEPVFAGRRG